MDPVFEEEQQHLTWAHGKLRQIEQELVELIEGDLSLAREDKEGMLADLGLDLTADAGMDVNLETFVELEALHKVIDDYNRTLDIRGERLARVRLLLNKPYFAKLTLQFPGAPAPRDVYIGAAAMTDENRRHFIVDWRSPVAEVYYNQAMGPTSYLADSRTIEVDLKLRRQFDIDGARLNSYFDTSVAIQDPLLLASLRRARTDRLGDITATIQKEQNQVIRHADVPVLVVQGIAGSGKTSVLLQRIAYLLYRNRETLRPDDVYLISPNDVFARYISDVLPNMGERNPNTLTWEALMAREGLRNRGFDASVSAEELLEIDERLKTFQLEPRDFCDLHVGDERVVPASQVAAAVRKLHPRIPAGPRLAALVAEELAERVEARVKRLAGTEDVQDSLFDLSTEEQFRIFGAPVQVQDERELRGLAETYLLDRYASVLDAAEDGAWLRIDRIGMRLLGKKSLSDTEYLYLKLALVGCAERRARYVMVDEVQDYTAAQLLLLARCFPNAHFLLLGDRNQALREGTASFQEMRSLFGSFAGEGGVAECFLATSYRSSPEITALFAGLMDDSSRMDVQSVQEPGVAPRVEAFDDAAAHAAAVRAAVEEARGQEGLTAVIAATWNGAQKAARGLEDLGVVCLTGNVALPASGVVVADVARAKGLEFDRVVIPDAQASVYGGDALSRRRLYTAISRATKQVDIFACGPLTPLLAGR